MYNFNKGVFLAIVFLIIISSSAIAHGGQENMDEEETSADWSDPVVYIKIVSILLAVVIALMFIARNFADKHKKSFFLIITIPVALSTLYLAGYTVYENLTSITKGPVHWHADYQVWMCDEMVELADPEGLSGKIGDSTLHEHDDNRIHVEGVVKQLANVNLGSYFDVIGGMLSHDEIVFPAHKGVMAYKNGEICPDNVKGILKVYVNGKRIEEPDAYVPSAEINVPPGDCIIFDFSPGNQEITDKICDSWVANDWSYESGGSI